MGRTEGRVPIGGLHGCHGALIVSDGAKHRREMRQVRRTQARALPPVRWELGHVRERLLDGGRVGVYTVL